MKNKNLDKKWGEIKKDMKRMVSGASRNLNSFCIHDVKHWDIHSPTERLQSLDLVKRSADIYLGCLAVYEKAGGIILSEHLYQENQARRILTI